MTHNVRAPSRAQRKRLTLIRLLAYIQGTALPGRTISAQKLASLFLGNLCFSFFAIAKIAPIDVLYC